MNQTLAHRGPDGHGLWFEDGGVAGLGHRRLAIIDLSETGHQPMVSFDGRWILTYNGETYNFAEIRSELEATGVRFRGTSDTEVIVEAIALWGVEETAHRLNGICAFAAWDRCERTLWLIRDRFGIKPLYWLHEGGEFAFGSELKALRAFPRWRPQVDVDALGSYFQFSYIPAPRSIYRNVHKLWAGGILRLDWGKAPKVWRYWDAFDVAARNSGGLEGIGDEEALDRLESALRDSVREQMVADVPLGAFLSGGIDSSAVVALMQAHRGRRVRTFSIGFSDTRFNEAPYARAVAEHLGTEHEELYVGESQALAVIPRLQEWYDEPHGDSSQIPTYLVSELARRHVTVALSGDGGDELFAGYPRYRDDPMFWDRMRAYPRWLRAAASSALRSVDGRQWATALRNMARRDASPRGGGTVLRLADAIRRDDPREFHRSMLSHWDDPRRIVPNAKRVETIFDRDVPANLDYRQMMQLIDSCTYLIDDVLAKVDRASMANSLEVRVPILDHRLYALSWQLPARMKLRGGAQKWALRNVLYRHVPRELIDRPKTGFGIPLSSWLRGELRDWGEALLAPRRLREEGYLDAAGVRRIWDDHQSGRFDNADRLWAVLQFQSWLSGEKLWADSVPERIRPLELPYG